MGGSAVTRLLARRLRTPSPAHLGLAPAQRCESLCHGSGLLASWPGADSHVSRTGRVHVMIGDLEDTRI